MNEQTVFDAGDIRRMCDYNLVVVNFAHLETFENTKVVLV